MVHATRILVDDISGTGPFMSVQLSNIFPQPVTFRTQETVAVLLHVVDVAKVVFIQVQIHGLLVTVGGTSYQSCCNISLFHLLKVVDKDVGLEQPSGNRDPIPSGSFIC
jgi:hypothetical protein